MKAAAKACGILLFVAGAATCQSTSGFPPDLVRGYADVAVAPPHNEIDTGLCTLAKANPYPNSTCSAFARYTLAGYLELRPFGRTPLRHLFGIFEPEFYGGDNIPQVRYTASTAPIIWESTVGAGYELSRHFQLRYTHHAVNLLGSYTGTGAASLRPDGPYGKNSTIGVRWNFAGPGHSTVPLGHMADVRGFLDLEVAPPYYEIDLGLCTLTRSNPANGGCAAYARYAGSGQFEFRPEASALRRITLFFEPKLFGGNNIPQLRYNGSPALILWEFSAGAALSLPKHFELRFTHHEVAPLTRYSGPNGAATLRSNGPYGPYATIGIRWSFGG